MYVCMCVYVCVYVCCVYIKYTRLYVFNYIVINKHAANIHILVIK